MVRPGLSVIKMSSKRPTQVWTKDDIHQSLKCRRCIHEPEWHLEILVVPVMRADHRLLDVTSVQVDLVAAEAVVHAEPPGAVILLDE